MYPSFHSSFTVPEQGRLRPVNRPGAPLFLFRAGPAAAKSFLRLFIFYMERLGTVPK
jgi:hypothetical protein